MCLVWTEHPLHWLAWLRNQDSIAWPGLTLLAGGWLRDTVITHWCPLTDELHAPLGIWPSYPRAALTACWHCLGGESSSWCGEADPVCGTRPRPEHGDDCNGQSVDIERLFWVEITATLYKQPNFIVPISIYLSHQDCPVQKIDILIVWWSNVSKRSRNLGIENTTLKMKIFCHFGANCHRDILQLTVSRKYLWGKCDVVPWQRHILSTTRCISHHNRDTEHMTLLNSPTPLFAP